MERAEFPGRVPPGFGHGGEFLDFRRIDARIPGGCGSLSHRLAPSNASNRAAGLASGRGKRVWIPAARPATGAVPLHAWDALDP